MSQCALESIDAAVIQTLSEIALPVLYDAFNRQRLDCMNFCSLNLLGLLEDSSGIYDSFVRSPEERIKLIGLHRYRQLERLLNRAFRQMMIGISNTLDRTDHDRAAIEVLFNRGANLGQIHDLTFGLSDMHPAGCVTGIQFQCGLRLIYKPRNLHAEEAFGQFANWLDGHLNVGFRLPTVLMRDAYGFVEFIDSFPQNDPSSANRFNYRLGCLFGAGYILNMSDFHYENVIQHGEYPVLIDLETVCQPRRHRSTCDAIQLGDESVLQVGFLPVWNVNGENKAISISILGVHTEGAGLERRTVLHSGTDVMTVRMIPVENAELSTLGLSGPALTCTSFLNGFTKTLECVLSERTFLQSSHSPLSFFHGADVRIVLRDTRTYARTLRILSDHTNAQDTEVLEKCLRSPTTGLKGNWPPPDLAEYFYSRERRALLQYVIPRFTTQAHDATLVGDGLDVHRSHLHEPGLDVIDERLNQLTPDFIKLQQQIILAAVQVHDISDKSGDKIKLDISCDHIETQLFMEHAAQIGRQICGDAIQGQDGSIAWIGSERVGTSGRYRLGLVDASLYNGSLGIAVFLAALFDATQEQVFKTIARTALDQAIGWIPALSRPGLGSGHASYLYVLPLVSAWLKDDSYLRYGGSVMGVLKGGLTQRLDSCDVLDGAAGIVLAALKWHQLQQDDESREIARGYGWAIVNAGNRLKELPEHGFAHGMPGVKTALQRLSDLTGFPKTNLECDRTSEGFSFSEQMAQSWCNGTIGTLMAMQSKAGSVIDEVDVLARRGFFVDHVCCGLFGAVELLVDNFVEASSPASLTAARALAAKRIANYKFKWKVLPGQTAPIPQPGFFQGLAGIGYTLLRLGMPTRYPSILSVR
jgi:type 2 lantibiotic biosynthesis protein LanM